MDSLGRARILLEGNNWESRECWDLQVSVSSSQAGILGAPLIPVSLGVSCPSKQFAPCKKLRLFIWNRPINLF